MCTKTVQSILLWKLGQMQTSCLLEELPGLCTCPKHPQLCCQNDAELFPQHGAITSGITSGILQECLAHSEDMNIHTHVSFALLNEMVVLLWLELPQDLIFCHCRWFTLLQISPQTRLSFPSLRSFYRGNFHRCYFNHAWNPIGNKVSLTSGQRCRFPRITASVR